MRVRRRARRLDRAEGLDDPVSMIRVFRDRPGIARIQDQSLTFEQQLGFPFQHVANRFVGIF